MSTKYHHLFFDLDRTLWDFDKNSQEAIVELFNEYELQSKLGADIDEFIKVYRQINDELWNSYKKNKIKKEELRSRRFYESFLHFDYDDKALGLDFNNRYIMTASSKTNLLDGAIDILEYLKEKYNLHLITNGFIETQNRKLDNCNLRQYFEGVVISDGMRYRKPDRRIFHHAMKVANAKSKNSLMIGDDYGSDILGAKRVGMDQVYLNDEHNINNQATFTIKKLEELQQFL